MWTCIEREHRGEKQGNWERKWRKKGRGAEKIKRRIKEGVENYWCKDMGALLFFGQWILFRVNGKTRVCNDSKFINIIEQ